MSVQPLSPSAFQPYNLGQQATPSLSGNEPPAAEAKDWFAEGLSYELGSGRHIDLDEACKCYENASKRDNVDGLVRLAFFRAHGIGCKVDSTESERLLQRAIDLRSEDAMFQLGKSLFVKNGEFGYGDNGKKGLQLIKMSVERGGEKTSVGGAIFMAFVSIVGSPQVWKDVQKGIQTLEETARGGNVSSLLTLGDLYHHGVSVQVNAQKALEYYRRAADLGSVDAFIKLGKLLLADGSAPVEEAMIRLWEEEAERNNHPGAQYLMGIIRWKGVHADRNDREAIRFLRMAADAGVGEAISHLGELGASYGKEAVGDGDLLRWARAGANALNAQGISRLARLYESGDGVDKDLQKAIDCYKSCLSFGFNAGVSDHLWHLFSRGAVVLQDMRAASEVVRQNIFDIENRRRFSALEAK